METKQPTQQASCWYELQFVNFSNAGEMCVDILFAGQIMMAAKSRNVECVPRNVIQGWTIKQLWDAVTQWPTRNTVTCGGLPKEAFMLPAAANVSEIGHFTTIDVNNRFNCTDHCHTATILLPLQNGTNNSLQDPHHVHFT
jgi:hypothetical protein